MMDEDTARNIRRLTAENSALRDANQALTERLARYEHEFHPHEAQLPEVHDELLSLAYDELRREREQHIASMNEMSDSWQTTFEESRREWQETCDLIEHEWKKSFDESEDQWKLSYHRSRGQLISMAIFFVVLAYGIAAFCTYQGAQQGLEAGLTGRSLEFSLVFPVPTIVILLAFIAWRIWHWRHPPTFSDQDE